MRNVAKQLAWHIGLLVLSVLFILGVRLIDRSFPVIKDFKVTSQKLQNGSVIIEGSLEKIRDCKFLELNAYTADGHKVWIDFLDRPKDRQLETRAVRVQLWGPWEIYTKGSSTITLYAHHACSIFWTQTIKLTNLTPIKVPAGEINNENE